MKIEIEMTEEQFEEMQLDLADIIWCLHNVPELQPRAIRLADKLESGKKIQKETP